MLDSKLKKLPLCHVKPEGWLKRQLEVQADGLSGNVSKLFKDLSENSAWLGGKGECWERGPYYLDGLVPLAYLLDDEKLKGEVQKWIESIFKSQREDGFFGPGKNLEWWPRMVVTKMLPDYCEATGDERVVPFLTKYYGYMSAHMDEQPLYNWANSRGIEEFIGLFWLYKVTKNEDLLGLMEKIKNQSVDWAKEFENFEFTRPSEEYMKRARFNLKKVTFYASDFLRNTFAKKAKPMSAAKIKERNENPFNRFYHLTHGVNVAMALKYPALSGYFSNDKNACGISKTAYDTIMTAHGTANGLFTCDEHLGGASPVRGTELCTVVETMYSAEKLFELTADGFWADLAEYLAYNALPATFTADMCAHQYVQQANQISATVAPRDWYDSYGKANIFGLKPNYACCLSNMHQGFPKFAEHLAFSDGDGIVLLAPIAMSVQTELNGQKIGFEVESDYPFKNTARIKVREGNFKLKLRKPKFAKSIKINGTKSEKDVVLNCEKGLVFEIEYGFDFEIEKNSDKTSVSCRYGALLLALDIKSETEMENPRDRFSDREFFPVSDWNYALIVGKNPYFEKTEADIDKELPFSKPPVRFTVDAAVAENWKEEKNSAGEIPKVLKLGERRKIELVPYGFTNLRISQFPIVKD